MALKGTWWWELKSSRVLSFWCYRESHAKNMGDVYVRVSFTQKGWLEQIWIRRTKFWEESDEQDEQRL